MDYKFPLMPRPDKMAEFDNVASMCTFDHEIKHEALLSAAEFDRQLAARWLLEIICDRRETLPDGVALNAIYASLAWRNQCHRGNPPDYENQLYMALRYAAVMMDYIDLVEVTEPGGLVRWRCQAASRLRSMKTETALAVFDYACNRNVEETVRSYLGVAPRERMPTDELELRLDHLVDAFDSLKAES